VIVLPPLPATAGGAPSDAAKAAERRQLESAAREFEAIFLRQLLAPLEKAGTVGAKGGVSSGSAVYGSILVGAVADSASRSGGIGLSSLILEAMTRGTSST